LNTNGRDHQSLSARRYPWGDGKNESGRMLWIDVNVDTATSA
jgi:hypothetical protein